MKKIKFIIPALLILSIVVGFWFVFFRIPELNYKSNGNDIKITYKKSSAGEFGLASNIYPILYLNNKIVSDTQSDGTLNSLDFYPLIDDLSVNTTHYEFTKDHSKIVITGYGSTSDAWYIFVDPEKFSKTEYESILKVLEEKKIEVNNFLTRAFGSGVVYSQKNKRLGGITYSQPIQAMQYTCDKFTSLKLYQNGKLEVNIQNIGNDSNLITKNILEEIDGNKKLTVPEIGDYYYSKIFPNTPYDNNYLLRCKNSNGEILGKLFNITSDTISEIPAPYYFNNLELKPL